MFFLAEYIDGKMLRDWIIDEAHSVLDRAKVARTILSDIASLHEVGIVHRDLAGDNILIDSNGRPFLVDFGLAKIKSELLVTKYSSQTVDPFTKAKYTPPKVFQARAKRNDVHADESWDLYALGVLLCEMFAGTNLVKPQSDIDDALLKITPIPGAIQMLLDNGYSDDAPSIRQVSVEINRELRGSDLSEALLDQDPNSQVLESLNEEISQLQRDLAAKRGKTELADIAEYLQRMGLVYTFHPKRKTITIDYSSTSLEKSTFVIDSRSEEVLEIHTLSLRTIKTKKKDLLELLNVLNWNSTILKCQFDPNDGEIRLRLCIAHANSVIPFEEFRAQLLALLKNADTVAEALDKEFTSPQRSALKKANSSKAQQDGADQPTTAPESKYYGGEKSKLESKDRSQ